MKHEVAILRCAGWRRERHPERARQRRARRIDVDECDLGARRLRAQERNQRADNAGADHRDAIGGTGCAVPHRVERGLHIGGEHRALRRQAVGKRGESVGRHREHVLVRMQREHHAAVQMRRAGFDLTDDRVAVLHRERKHPAHVGSTHAHIFGRRHAAGEDQRLGPATDGTKMGMHAGLVRPRRDAFVAQFCHSGCDVPERLRHRCMSTVLVYDGA